MAVDVGRRSPGLESATECLQPQRRAIAAIHRRYPCDRAQDAAVLVGVAVPDDDGQTVYLGNRHGFAVHVVQSL